MRALRGGFVRHRQRRRADSQSRRVSDRPQLLRHRSRQGAEAGVVGHGRASSPQQMLPDHVKEHGRYPQKVSFVIWGDETMRHEGVLESQIFYLLGTKPIWNDRGKVIGVQVIPQRTTQSAARGHRHLVRRRRDVQQRHAADGRGRPEGEGARRSGQLRPLALPVDQGHADLARLFAGRRRPARRRAHLRRAAGQVQPEHVDDCRHERHLGQRQGHGRRLHPQARSRLWQRLLGRVDGGRLPHGALRHREDRPQQFDDALRRARQRRHVHVRGRPGHGDAQPRRQDPRDGGHQHARPRSSRR